MTLSLLHHHSKSGVRFALALPEAEIRAFKVSGLSFSWPEARPGSCWRPLTIAVAVAAAVAPLAKAVTTQDGQGRISESFQPDPPFQHGPKLKVGSENSAKL
jgi:hypothetical protein